MKKPLSLGLGLLLLAGCASDRKAVVFTDEDFAGKPLVIVNDVPFVEQTRQLCGPTALYMAAKSYLPSLTLEEVTRISYTPALKGTLKHDLLGAARRLGLAPYKVESLPRIIEALSAKIPVVIFHKTHFLWRDYWHYSVVVGYNRPDESFSVHIGDAPYQSLKIDELMESWEEGGSWAYVMMPPDQSPPFARLEEARENGQVFARLGLEKATNEIHKEIRRRWPN